MDGFEEIQNPDVDIFRMYIPDIAAFTEAGHKPGETVICTGKIKHVGSTYVDQWEYLKNLVPKDRVHECKLTLAAPNWYHLRYKEGKAYPQSVYSSDTAYFADIAKAYQTELQILYDHGLRNVQIDDPNLACNIIFISLSSRELTIEQTSARRRCWLGGKKTRAIRNQRKTCLMTISNCIMTVYPSVLLTCTLECIFAEEISSGVVTFRKVDTIG